MSKRKTHYYGASDPNTIKRHTSKLILRHRLELLKAVLKIAAGLTIITPLNAPAGWLLQLTASLIWVMYCGIGYYLQMTRRGGDRYDFWLF